MKIAVEAQRIFRKNKHGMDFVALETIRELQKTDQENEYYILTAPGEDRCLEATPNFHIVELHNPAYPLWEQIALPRALRRIRPDLLHCTSNTAPLFCNVPLVLTLHDIIFLEKKAGRNTSLYQNLGRSYRRLVVPRILPHCRKIITVSDYERHVIQTALKLDKEQIVTVYNGYNRRFRPLTDPGETTQRYLPEKKYLFFLGNTDPKKNTPRTLKAYSLYLQRSSFRLPLLVADLEESVIDRLLREEGIGEIKPMLRFPGYIPHADLPAIYNGASAFLYTSLRESFGIPLLEAMACGTPVVTSATSAIPEIAGEGAILTDPENPEEIAEALLRLEKDPAYRERQIQYGLTRAGRFSWENTARETLDIYRSLIH